MGTRTRSGDAGFTLIEMLIALVIFSIFITLALAAVLRLTTATVDAQGRTVSASETLNAFQLIDRQVRYASAVNYPGKSATGASYVEFLTLAGASRYENDTCTQWRYLPADGLLQTRDWRAGTTPGSTWATKVTEVKGTATATYPFKLLPATVGGFAQQRLVLDLSAGGPDDASRTVISTNYVARNSSLKSSSNADANGDGVSDVPICGGAGNRP